MDIFIRISNLHFECILLTSILISRTSIHNLTLLLYLLKLYIRQFTRRIFSVLTLHIKVPSSLRGFGVALRAPRRNVTLVQTGQWALCGSMELHVSVRQILLRDSVLRRFQGP